MILIKSNNQLMDMKSIKSSLNLVINHDLYFGVIFYHQNHKMWLKRVIIIINKS